MSTSRILPLAVIAPLIIAIPLGAAEPVAAALQGVWLFDGAATGKGTGIGAVWNSTLTISGDSFVIGRFMGKMGVSKDLKGKIVLGVAGPNTVNLKVEELDLSASGKPMKVPAATLPGIYKHEGDRLIVCFNLDPDKGRPAEFDSGDESVLVTLAKADAGFKDFPKEITVTAKDANGKPVAGAVVAGFMSLMDDPEKKDSKREWRHHESTKTGDDGTVKLAFDKLQPTFLLARDPSSKRIGMARASPYRLSKGEVNITLGPECRVSGTLTSSDLKKAGQEIAWTNVYAMRDGERFAMCDSKEGKFEFILPPGTYALNAYGTDLRQKYVKVTVPAGKAEFTVDPIVLSASRLVQLRGQPAPELEGVIGWKGDAVKLADLKGKYVLLDFWGYWCGPCVGAMPVLIELHDKYKDKGLAIVGVHVDNDGDVDTVAKLDEKIAGYKAELWKGRDVPFPVALTSGKHVGEQDAKSRGLAASQYGVLGYPTTILIDRDGKVVGLFHAREIKAASEEVEKLLAGTK
jgi:uncharacterized protein (TIGR03067 family)